MRKILIISTILVGIAWIPLGFNACGAGVGKVMELNGSSNDKFDVTDTDPVVAGEGHKYPGAVGALAVPTPDALALRITNGLEKQVSPVAGNFATSMVRFRSNLPKMTDPTKVAGYDAAQLVVYGACSDLTTGTTPKMQSVYNIPATGAIDATQKAALVAVGMRMLNKHTAGLASNVLVKADIETALMNMLKDLADDAENNTTKIGFMSVCMAANTAGAMLLSF